MSHCSKILKFRVILKNERMKNKNNVAPMSVDMNDLDLHALDDIQFM